MKITCLIFSLFILCLETWAQGPISDETPQRNENTGMNKFERINKIEDFVIQINNKISSLEKSKEEQSKEILNIKNEILLLKSSLDQLKGNLQEHSISIKKLAEGNTKLQKSIDEITQNIGISDGAQQMKIRDRSFDKEDLSPTPAATSTPVDLFKL